MGRQVDVSEQRTELTIVDLGAATLRQSQDNWRNLRSSIDTVKDALAATGVVIGAGAMGKLYLDVVKTDASLVDMSESAGASVENLSKLREIAEIGGRDFGGYTEQLGKMIKGLKSGNEDGQKASYALKQLGVEAKGANGVFRDTAEVSLDIARGLAKYADDGNKAALVQDALGKGADRYLPFLKDMVRYSDQQAAVTTEQAKQAREYLIQVNRLNQAFEDGRRTVVQHWLPTATNAVEQMEYGTRIAGGFANAIRLFGTLDPGPGVADNIAKINDQLERWQKAGPVGRFFQKPLGATYEGTGKDMQLQLDFLKFMQRQQALNGRIGPQFLDARDLQANPALKPSSGYQSPANLTERLKLSPFQARMLEMKTQATLEATGPSEFIETSQAIKAGKYTAVDQATGKVRELTAAEKQQLLAAAASRDTERQLAEIRREGAKASEEAAKAADDYYKSLVLEAEAMKLLLDPGRQYMRDQEKLTELVRRGLLTEEQAIAAQRKMLETRTNVNDLGKTLDVTAEASHQFGISFTSAMDRVVFDSKRGIDAMALLEATAMDVAKVVWTSKVTQPLAGGLEGAFGKLFGGGKGSTPSAEDIRLADPWGSMPDPWKFAGGGVMTARGPLPLRTYSGGGVASSPQVAVFGEGDTDEAFVPVPNGRIPVQMKGKRGGGDVYITHGDIVVQGAGVTIADVRRAQAASEQRTIAAVRELMRR